MSSSGFGDGSYGVYGKRAWDEEKLRYVSLRLSFIPGVLEAVHTPLARLPLLIGVHEEPADKIIEIRIKEGI